MKDIEIREGLTAHNLRTIVSRKMLIVGDKASLIWNGVELTGHKKLNEMGIIDGDIVKLKDLKETEELSVVNGQGSEKD